MIFGMDICTCAIKYLQLVHENVDLSFQNCSMGISILHCIHISMLAWFSSVQYGLETRCIHTTQSHMKNYTVVEAHIIE